MTTRNTEQPQGESGSPSVAAPPPSGSHEHLRSNSGNTVFKSGPLFLSSKGIGWTSWKKRWFILTRTSLVFFRSDPNAVPQKGSEVNLTLGGIDLNNSGRVDFKVEKKLLTVLFPDGRDGRAFTLKAETLEDLFEWKDALENALAQAPSPSNAMGQNGIFRNDQTDSVDGSLDQQTEIQPITSKVIGRPVLLALEEVDGTPSFLEKALQFIEEHGAKVEGILRQAAYVQDVERRIREYEQGKTEFSAEEDAHVIADCVKYIIRELPSSPVPASCCKALLEAIRTDRAVRVNNVRAAICDTFPEPNRRLLQRILTMMQKIVSNKVDNRMSCSAVAACMAPLLLRPLLAGDCEIENDFDVGGDNSLQLLQAAAAANHAQVIVITLLDEYDKIFGEGSMTPDLYSDEDESGSETEEETEDDVSYEDDESDDLTQESDAETDDEIEIVSSGTCSEDYDSGDKDDLQQDKEKDGCGIGPNSHEADDNHEAQRSVSSKSLETSVPQPNTESNKNEQIQDNKIVVMASNESAGVARDSSQDTGLANKCPPPCMQKSTSVSNRPRRSVKSQWGRTSARKNLSMESVDFSLEDEADLQGHEASKSELENKIAEEAEENAVLHENLERHMRTIHRRRLALEQDVERLQEQLQIERDTRAALEAGLKISQGPIPNLATVDKKTKAELEEVAVVEADIANLKQRVDDLGMQLNQHREQTQDYQEKQKDKGNDNGTLARSHCVRSGSKNANLSREENENEEMPEMSSSVSKHTPQPAVAKTSSSKKSAAKGEGTNFTSSTLTKLTNRLNFLKERRSQITNDLQNMEKGRVSSQEQNDGQFYDKRVRTEEQGSRKSEKVKKLESQSLNQAEREKRSKGQVSHTLDRGKSESNFSIDIEKGRVVEGQPSVSQKKSTR